MMTKFTFYIASSHIATAVQHLHLLTHLGWGQMQLFRPHLLLILRVRYYYYGHFYTCGTKAQRG